MNKAQKKTMKKNTSNMIKRIVNDFCDTRIACSLTEHLCVLKG